MECKSRLEMAEHLFIESLSNYAEEVVRHERKLKKTGTRKEKFNYIKNKKKWQNK